MYHIINHNQHNVTERLVHLALQPIEMTEQELSDNKSRLVSLVQKYKKYKSALIYLQATLPSNQELNRYIGLIITCLDNHDKQLVNGRVICMTAYTLAIALLNVINTMQTSNYLVDVNNKLNIQHVELLQEFLSSKIPEDFDPITKYLVDK